MSEVRLIDAIALEKTAIPCETHNGALTELCVPLYQIRAAPTLPNPCNNPCNFTKPTLRHVTINHPNYGKAAVWYDEARQLVFYNWTTKEVADKIGWIIEEEEDI